MRHNREIGLLCRSALPAHTSQSFLQAKMTAPLKGSHGCGAGRLRCHCEGAQRLWQSKAAACFVGTALRLPRQPFGLPRNDNVRAAVPGLSLRGESEANDVAISGNLPLSFAHLTYTKKPTFRCGFVKQKQSVSRSIRSVLFISSISGGPGSPFGRAVTAGDG